LPAWIRRHRRLYWLVALALAGVSAHEIASAVARAEAARAAWGESQTVLVAQHRLEFGDVVGASDVATESWPAAVVPRGAGNGPDDVVGRTVVEVVEPGEAVLTSRLAPDGLHGVTALVPSGWRALAVPLGSAPLPLSVGDHVDLVAAVDGTTDDASRSPAFVLADNALVLAVDGQSVTVAVPADDSPRVALGIVTGSVVPALRSA
jgi:pilus assembly protein CpaB